MVFLGLYLCKWVSVDYRCLDFGDQHGLKVALLLNGMNEFRKFAEDDCLFAQGIFAILYGCWRVT